MASELIQSLASKGTRYQVEALLRGALRDPAPGELDALLLSWIDAHPGPLTALCHDAGEVSVSGWGALDAGMAALAANGTLCTAIGIELTERLDGGGPGLDVGLYWDASFPFSTSDRSAILAAFEAGGLVGPGKAEDAAPSLTCSGLEDLCAAVTNHPQRYWPGDDEMPDDYPDYFIGAWYLHLRVDRALAAALDEDCLPYPMPVIVSAGDFGPKFETVHMLEKAIEQAVELPPEPDAVMPEVEAPEVTTLVIDEPEVEPVIDAATDAPKPSRGWPWRKSSSKAEIAVENDPIRQRRRGPGSFAAG